MSKGPTQWNTWLVCRLFTSRPALSLSRLPCSKRSYQGVGRLLYFPSPRPVQSSLPHSDAMLVHFLHGWMLRRYMYVHVNYYNCFKRHTGSSFRQRDKPALRDNTVGYGVCLVGQSDGSSNYQVSSAFLQISGSP